MLLPTDEATNLASQRPNALRIVMTVGDLNQWCLLRLLTGN